ncbi:lysosome-associated membrane glycoprotein 2 isoform X2 [Neoarius graeffei]|uniref:lysosome-associated membrane glycoprotein 2 isoform X2 n=1 Tax=Neoarius graeffei TaxID=443677 RepID=UPI00298D0DF1|nr:lysosome-associated membrane glycoprotein 2 isoform X2 [Neoarius graeffei]
MFRCVCLFILLPSCVLGQADLLLATPSKSSVSSNDQPVWEGNYASVALPTTEGSVKAVIASTPEPYVPDATTSQPAADSSDAKEKTTLQSNATTVATTAAPAPQPTNATTAAPAPQPTNATTAAPAPQPTNATTAAPAPQPTNATTAAPAPQPTNATTAAPAPQPTNATTAAPTTPPLPEIGDYVVRAEWNSSACLMARMGLQFSFRMGDSFQTINLNPNPNVTTTSGTCGNNGSDSALVLKSDTIIVQFIFTIHSSNFFMRSLNLTVVPGSGPSFTAVNTSLSLWEASLGSSYMCKKEQSFNITDALILNTFNLQVQPFGVLNDKFSTAHECSVDDTSLLIPIIVGAALAVMILIVVIAYMIGRRKTYVGYQTL